MFHGSVSRCECFQVVGTQSEVGSRARSLHTFVPHDKMLVKVSYALLNPSEIGQKLFFKVRK